MDSMSRALQARRLLLALESVLKELDGLEYHLAAAKVSSAMDALSEESGFPLDSDQTQESIS